MIKKEVIDKNWTTNPATMAILLEFQIYNPTIQMFLEKKVAIEFLPQGGFINIEHQCEITNLKLYMTTNVSAVSAIIQVLGIILMFTSLYSI